MKEEIEKRIKELKETLDSTWASYKEKQFAENRLERLEQLQDDLYGY